jgi:hypothetical protein
MTCAFMGTVIALERAVAVKHPLAFLGPVASARAGVGDAHRRRRPRRVARRRRVARLRRGDTVVVVAASAQGTRR